MRAAFLLAAAAACAAAQARLEVVVTEEPFGSPLRGARVSAAWTSGRFSGLRQPLVCETDGAGICTFNAGQPGAWQVRVSMPGYLDADDPQSRFVSERIAVAKEGARFRVSMIRGGLLEGGVYASDGKPVRGAVLRMRRILPEGAPPARLVLTGKTGEDGRFQLDEVPPGRYGMWIAPPEEVRLNSLRTNRETGETTGYAVKVYHTGVEEPHWVEPVEVWPGAQLTNRVVVLRPARVYPFRGRLIDQQTGEPLAGAQVALRTADELKEEVFRGRDVHPATGGFEFPGLAEGEYELLVTRKGLDPVLPMVVGVQVRGDLDRRREFIVPAWVSLPGWVEGHRRRAFESRQATVTLTAVEGAAGELAVSPAPDGRFVARHMPPGRYRVSVQPGSAHSLEEVRLGEQDVTTGDFEVGPGMGAGLLVRLGAAGAELSGRAVRANGEPAPRAYVILIHTDERKRQRSDLFFTARANETGAWTLGMAPPGVYVAFCFERRPELDPRSEQFWQRHVRQGIRVEAPPGGALYFDLTVAGRSD
jgi:hypothetical protein